MACAAAIGIKTGSDARVDPALGRDQRVGAEPLDHGQPRQDGLRAPALLDDAPHEVFVRPRQFGLTVEPGLQIPRAAAREHPVAVDRAQLVKMLAPRLCPDGIAGQSVGAKAELRPEET